MSVDNILNRLSELKARALQSLNGIDDTEAVDSWRVDYLGTVSYTHLRANETRGRLV